MADPNLLWGIAEKGYFVFQLYERLSGFVKQRIPIITEKKPKREPPLSPPIVDEGKILFVGGGEIAVEIGLVATESSWGIHAVDEENEDGAMKRFSEVAGYSGSLDVYEEISSLSLPLSSAFRAIALLEGIIIREKPEFVLLEKNFIPLENWMSLQRAVRRYFDKRGRKITFIPGLETADFFIDKIKMKEKLKHILGEKLSKKHLINDYIIIDLENDRKTEVKNIKEFLRKHKRAILKPSITESGKGQSEIESEDDIIEGLDNLNRAEVTSQKAILEEKKDIASEVFYALFRPVFNLKSNFKVIGPIQYEKQSFEFGGPVRLKRCFYPPENIPHKAMDIMRDLNSRIADHVEVPYLGIEYLLCKDSTIFVNEIVWRPEDAGFITLLSHTKSQFELFVDCLEKESIEEPRICNEHFSCISIMRDTEFETFPENARFNGRDWIAHFYHKGFRVPSKRTTCYGVVNLGEGEFTTIDEFKTYLRNLISKEFGKGEVGKLYF